MFACCRYLEPPFCVVDQCLMTWWTPRGRSLARGVPRGQTSGDVHIGVDAQAPFFPLRGEA
eukprot:1309231-Alexandrium_andersonii.AAC.1